jgi:dCTP deaminase
MTLEYVALPADVYADILTRSSYARLGIPLNTMIQPGYRGCIAIELFNEGNNPVELIVGSRIVQARLFSTSFHSNYNSGAGSRKYMGNVRPTVSRAQFAVDAWRAPKRIFDAHPPHQYAQLRVDLRSPSRWA